MRPARGALRPLPQGVLRLVLFQHMKELRAKPAVPILEEDSEAPCLINHGSSHPVSGSRTGALCEERQEAVLEKGLFPSKLPQYGSHSIRQHA